MPVPMLFAMVSIAVGGVGAVYAGYRANGFRAFLPFQKESALKLYLHGMKYEGWPKWPIVIWLASIPIAFFFFILFVKGMRPG